MKFYKVTWIDAVHGGGWDKTEDLGKPTPVTSCGWLSTEGADYIVLSASRYEGYWGQTIIIPSGMIVEKVEVNV